jgi:hypothetical protein
LGDLGVADRIILRYILKRYGVWMWTGFIWLRIGTRGNSCEYDNKPSGAIRN